MIVKVCGMREAENIKALGKLGIDYMGMIFYEKSARNVSRLVKEPINAVKVGVFVNADFGFIQKKITEYELGAIQLHGDESADFCKELKQIIGNDVKIFKAFRVDQKLTSEHIVPYEQFADMYILDSGGKKYGGNGVKWDYGLLDTLEIKKPFLLSGGLDDSVSINELCEIHPRCVGVDLNSKFEIEAGIKDINKIKRFLR